MFECVEPVVFRSCSGDEWYDGSSANVQNYECHSYCGTQLFKKR